MAWIQIDTGIRENNKIYNLADALKISDAHAVGFMVCLWTWAATTTPSGDITNHTPHEIARAAGWQGRPSRFYKALDAHGFTLHDGGKVFLTETLKKIITPKEREERAKAATKNRAKRESPAYKGWRKAVFKRDNYTCQMCGRRGGTLNAHHIEAFASNKEKRLDVSNGLTLCKKCHKIAHGTKTAGGGINGMD